MDFKKIFSKNKKEFENEKKVLTTSEKTIEQNYYDAVKKLEQDSNQEINKQKDLFKKLFVLSIIVVFVEALAITCLLPLKTIKTVVLRVDNNTGYVDIAPDIQDAQSTYNEATNKYFLGQYVINYESYDWATIQHMSNVVKLMSNTQIFNKYDNNLRNEVSPLTLFKDQSKVSTKISAVTFLDKDFATVRFTKFVVDNQGKVDNKYPISKWIATIKFAYSKNIHMEKDRLINPLGFEVISYRVDPER